MTFDDYNPKGKKKFCTLEKKLNIITDYKRGMKIKDLNKKYKINVCNINYWVKNEENFKMKKHLFKKTIHSGAFRKINIDENELILKLQIMHKDQIKINTMVIFEIVKDKYLFCSGVKDYHIKSWIYRFVKKHQLKSRFFEKKKSLNFSEVEIDNQSIISDIDMMEYNRLNNKPFYIEKILIVGQRSSYLNI